MTATKGQRRFVANGLAEYITLTAKEGDDMMELSSCLSWL